MKKVYKDSCGSYSITTRNDGSAILRCRNNSNNHLDVNKQYKSTVGAIRALSRYCGGMPSELKTGGQR